MCDRLSTCVFLLLDKELNDEVLEYQQTVVEKKGQPTTIVTVIITVTVHVNVAISVTPQNCHSPGIFVHISLVSTQIYRSLTPSLCSNQCTQLSSSAAGLGTVEVLSTLWGYVCPARARRMPGALPLY